MGSDLYRVTTLAKSDRAISLAIVVVHPDAIYIPADPSFALMVLHEAAEQGDALAGEVSFDDTLDTTWVKHYAKGFIRTVKVSGIIKKRTSMRGRMDITVSDPAWIAHIKKGDGWDSRAFALIGSYDDHALITPGSKGVATDEDGFVWVPRECFMDFTNVSDDMPALLEMPAYAPSAYAATERVEKPSRKVLQSWLGRAAIVDGTHGSVSGVTRDSVTLARFDQGSRGFSTEQASWIARPQLTSGRRGTKLAYERVLAQAAITATIGKKSGTSLELALRMPPDQRKVPIASETDVLHLLARATIEDDQFRPSPLAKALEADLEAHELEGTHRLEEIYPFIAKAYVASVEIDRPKRVKASKDMHALLAGPWPTATVRIVVTDKKWIAHWDSEQTVVVPEHPFPKPKAAPKRAPAPVHDVADARVVLHGDGKVWIAERTGASWTARWGKTTRKDRQTKTYQLASPEKAQAQLDKTAATKIREGYKRAPSDAAEIVWKRLGLAFDDASGVCIVTKAAPTATKLEIIDTIWYKPKDHVEAINNVHVSTVEEIAYVLGSAKKGAPTFLDSFRPASRTSTKVAVPLA